MIPDLAIFSGSVFHSRRHPHRYRFRQPLLMLFVNVAHIDALAKKIAPFARLGILGWRRQDYLPDSCPLAEAALHALHKRTGVRATGPIYVLAQPRQFGVSYNPATFYFICDGDKPHAAHLLVEVHNTPWGERFCYAGHYTDGRLTTSTMEKQHRVSPFNPPHMIYEWRYSQPQKTFFINMRCHSQDTLHFEATLLLRRQPFSRRRLLLAVLRQPLSAAFSFIAIYWHALRLWQKKTPLYRE